SRGPGRVGRSGVEGDVAARIGSVQHMVVVVRIDPQVVRVAARELLLGERLAAVGRAVGADVLDVDEIFVLGIGEDVGVIEGALAEPALVVDKGPGGAGVVGAEQAAVLVLDEREDAIRIDGRDRDADLAVDARRQTFGVGDFGPGLAAVGRLVQSAARAAARHSPFVAIGLPERGVHDIRIGAVDLDVGGAGLVILVEDLAPGLSAVGALEHAALGARRAELPEVGEEDDVGVGGVDSDVRNGIRALEPDVRPGLAGVGRLVDAVARLDVAANLGLAHADVNDVRIALRHGDRADRRAPDLPVGDVGPALTAVGRLPQAATRGAEIADLGLTADAADRDRSATALGAEAPPAEPFKDRRIDWRRRGANLRPLGTAHRRNDDGHAAGDRRRGQTGSKDQTHHEYEL